MRLTKRTAGRRAARLPPRSCASTAKACGWPPASSSTGGLDGGKHVNGRKRQILTDVQGRLLACRGHAANGHDGVEALRLLPQRPGWGARLLTLVTDKSYRGRFARHLARLGLTHQVGSRPPSARGFVPVAKRWVVERTFAWLTGFRRLAIDYEFAPRSHETWLLVANMTMCLNRLCPA